MNISLPHQSDMHAACKLVFLELRINHSRPRLSASVTKAHIRFLCCLGWISVVLHIDFPSRLPDKLTIMLMWSTNENEPCYIDYKIAILVLMFSQPHPDKPMPDHPNQSLQSSSCCRVPWSRRQKFGRRSLALDTLKSSLQRHFFQKSLWLSSELVHSALSFHLHTFARLLPGPYADLFHCWS